MNSVRVNMIKKYINKAGAEQKIHSSCKLASLIKDGHINDSTLLYSNESNSWKIATDFQEYREAKSYSSNNENTRFTGGATAPFLDKLNSKFGRLYLPWLLLASSFLIIYLTEAFLDPVGDSESSGAYYVGRCAYYVGSFFGSALILGIIAHKISKLSYFLCFAIVFLGSSVLHAVSVYEQKDAVKGIASDALAVIDGTDFKGQSNNFNLSDDGQALNSIKPIITSHVEAQVAAQNTYSAATEAIFGILDPINLADSNKTAENLQKLNTFEQATYRYFDNIERIYAKTLEKIREANIDPVFRESFIESMNKGYSSTARLMEQYKNCELNIARKLREIIAFVSKSPVELSAENQLLFETDTEVNYYNGLLEDFDKLVQQEEFLASEIQKFAEARRANLERLADY